MIEFERESNNRIAVARIKVLGVGGGGSNMVNSMVESSGYDMIDFIVANTDAQALKISNAPHKIQLGIKSTKGLGAGANPEVGRRAAEEDLDTIIRQVKDADVVFFTAGLGGGTGSGALPIIAQALKEKDILSIAVVTKPFMFEGRRRARVAEEALHKLEGVVDTLIVIPNQKLLDVVDQKVSLLNAFDLINSVLNQFIKSIADIIAKPGHINVDFADIKTIMKQRGYAVIGTGRGSGPDRAVKAAREAIVSPLLDNTNIKGAQGVLLNISGSSSLSLHEVGAASHIIYEEAHEDASIIVGSVIDESLGDEVIVTIIATGFESDRSLSVQPATKHSFEQESSAQEKIPTQESPVGAITLESKPGEEEPGEHKLESKPEAKKEEVDVNDFEIPAIMRQMLKKNQE